MEMLKSVLYTISLSCIGAVLYRIGGIGGKWYLNTKVRDLGVPAATLGLLYLLGGTAVWWVWLASYLWMYVAMTTYCRVGKQLIPDPHRPVIAWYNWLLTGLHYGVAMLPFIWYNNLWIGGCIRTFWLGIAIMAWSELMDDDFLEEGGRGFLTVATIPMLCIHIRPL